MSLPALQTLIERAAGHKGLTREAFVQTLERAKGKDEIRAIPDDRWLSMISRRVFQAGFNWKVIDAKWPGFEEAFLGFEPARCAFLNDDDLDRLLKDERIVRHGAKIRSVIDNARFVREMAAERGSFGDFVADWPTSDYVGLLEVFKTRGSRLSGSTPTYVLRGLGVPSFILSADVSKALIAAGVVDKAPTSKRDLKAVQTAFNTWAEESGLSLTEISRILALSVGPAA